MCVCGWGPLFIYLYMCMCAYSLYEWVWVYVWVLRLGLAMGLLLKVIYTKLHANKQNEKSLQSSRLCVCFFVFNRVCVCVSLKSNGNENNEARFCAHISKAKQKKNTKETRKIEWGACPTTPKTHWRAREIVRCVKLKKKGNHIHIYCVISAYFLF